MYDSLYNECKSNKSRIDTVLITKEKTNWFITIVTTVGALLLNWAIYLTINK